MTDYSKVPQEETWRVFRIMAEFVEGFEELSQIGPAVTIFGSARSVPGSKHYELAVATARAVGNAGFAVITGGGGGIMEAANKGAAEVGVRSVGLNIDLPQEQTPNEFQNLSLHFRYFFCRKVMFLKYAHGFIVMPGGYGTLDEFSEALVLIQTLKQAHFPVICMGTEYWKGLIDWFKDVMLNKHNYIDGQDLKVFTMCDDPEEAAKIITNFHKSNGRGGIKSPPGIKKVWNGMP
jgi:hypothetical protein